MVCWYGISRYIGSSVYVKEGISKGMLYPGLGSNSFLGYVFKSVTCSISTGQHILQINCESFLTIPKTLNYWKVFGLEIIANWNPKHWRITCPSSRMILTVQGPEKCYYIDESCLGWVVLIFAEIQPSTDMPHIPTCEWGALQIYMGDSSLGNDYDMFG